MTRDDVIEIYDRLIAAHPDLKRKGAKSAYTALNGNMFSFVDAAGLLAIRLSKEDKADYNATHDPDPVIQYNATMNGYVKVTPALLANEAALADWFAKSVDFGRNLPPKPTRKTPKKSAK